LSVDVVFVIESLSKVRKFNYKANCSVANKDDIKNHVTAIPAKTLALRVFIGQGANCVVLDARLKFFLFFHQSLKE